MEKIYTIDEIKNIITPIAKQHNVGRVYLFGSYARGEADEKSDIDLRIDASQIKGMFALGALYSDIENALKKSVDIVTTDALEHKENRRYSEKFYTKIRKDERLIYEQEY